MVTQRLASGTKATMSVTLIDRDLAPTSVGASFRPLRPGPERDLIDWFIEQEPVRIPHGCRATLFCEPRLDSGFPDLVLVLWKQAITENWSPRRLDLTNPDIRLIHHLANSGPQTEERLEQLLPRDLHRSLARLESAEMVRFLRGQWTPRPLSTIFATTHIVAIEAKINEWTAAIDQARLNFWFASNSYVLFPRRPRNERFLSVASSSGIGVWSKEDAFLDGRALGPSQPPRSYGSWLLNEWAWRASTVERTSHL